MTEFENYIISHGDTLPTVRIKKVIIKNFKSINFGEIEFNCGRKFIPYGTESDILGIYGQNGSGKTSLIEALSILNYLMEGAKVPDVYSDCVSLDKEYSELFFTFDLQYPNGNIREASYEFCMSKRKKMKEEINEEYKNIHNNLDFEYEKYKVVIFNERLSLRWEGSAKKQYVIDTSSSEIPFCPQTKLKEMTGLDKKLLLNLEIKKQLAYEKSTSFIFMEDVFDILGKYNNSSAYFGVLCELRYFARAYFYVIDTKSSGFIRLNFSLPIYTRDSLRMFHLLHPMTIEDEDIEEITLDLKAISDVLHEIVPGLSLKMKKLTSTLNDEGKPSTSVMLVAEREGKEIPLRNESDGVRKIISILSLIISAFNEKSVTVAIDEFDAGIFEYLLGEILQIFEESGKGQLIFTSHNLRPLEVINKKFLYFTTANPDKRFIRLKNISSTNNLRDTYFREIILNEQEEKIYNKTKRFKIVAALKKAGDLSNGKTA